jgi:uncharacterized protein
MREWLTAIGLLPQRQDSPRDIELEEGHVPAKDPNAVGCFEDPRHALTRSESHPGFVATSTGRLFDVVNPRPEEIEIEEIAHALSQINRFGGHTKFPYSVAQHSGLCAAVCEHIHPGKPELALACLLHDAAEAYCGDVIRPIKRLIASAYRPLENRIQAAIWQRFELQVDWQMEAAIKAIDDSVVMEESRALMHGSQDWNWEGVTPANINIIQMTPAQVRTAFLMKFSRCRSASTSSRQNFASFSFGYEFKGTSKGDLQCSYCERVTGI